jgi:hypothetical protein
VPEPWEVEPDQQRPRGHEYLAGVLRPVARYRGRNRTESRAGWGLLGLAVVCLLVAVVLLRGPTYRTELEEYMSAVVVGDAAALNVDNTCEAFLDAIRRDSELFTSLLEQFEAAHGQIVRYQRLGGDRNRAHVRVTTEVDGEQRTRSFTVRVEFEDGHPTMCPSATALLEPR